MSVRLASRSVGLGKHNTHLRCRNVDFSIPGFKMFYHGGWFFWCEQCVSLWMYARAKPLDWPGRLIKGMTIQYNTHNAILARAPNKGGDWQASLWRHCQTLPGGRCLFLTLIIFFLPLVLYAFYQWGPWPENLIFWGILHFTNKQIWDLKNKETTWPQIIILVPDISLNSKYLLKKLLW